MTGQPYSPKTTSTSRESAGEVLLCLVGIKALRVVGSRMLLGLVNLTVRALLPYVFPQTSSAVALNKVHVAVVES
jgi:hypothetical protein